MKKSEIVRTLSNNQAKWLAGIIGTDSCVYSTIDLGQIFNIRLH